MDKEERILEEKKSIFYAAGLFFSDHRYAKDKIKIQDTLSGDSLKAFKNGLNLDPLNYDDIHDDNIKKTKTPKNNK